MKNVKEATAAVMESLDNQIKAGQFTESNWVGSNFSVMLTAPYPEYSIEVTARSGPEDLRNAFEVKIDTAAGYGCPLSLYSSYFSRDNVLDAVEELLHKLTCEVPNGYIQQAHILKAFEFFGTVPVDHNGNIQDDFLHFKAGTSRCAVLDWFNKISHYGISWLCENSKSEKKLYQFRIPLVWENFGYATVFGMSQKEALAYALGDAPLPHGEYVTDSCAVDKGTEIECTSLKEGTKK